MVAKIKYHFLQEVINNINTVSGGDADNLNLIPFSNPTR